jgi:hypothetical protein
VQHAEKTAAETKAERFRGLRLEMQRGVVQAQLGQGFAKAFIVPGIYRIESGKDVGF